MNSDELRILIETARIKKGISQRELSKQTGISRSTLNDLIIYDMSNTPDSINDLEII